MPTRRLDRRFYARPTLMQARALLGQRLVRRIDGRRLSGFIVETEAYIGEEDLACHAAVGRTARNEAMYGPPGHAYVYLVYGMHHCLNIVSEPPETPAAILIRALEPSEGVPAMAARRGLAARLRAEAARRAARSGSRRRADLEAWLADSRSNPGPVFRSLLSGPGRLCQALAIDRRMTGRSLLGSDLFVETGAAPRRIIAARRVGVEYAGPWRDKPWRFLAAESPWTSRPGAARAAGSPIASRR